MGLFGGGSKVTMVDPRTAEQKKASKLLYERYFEPRIGLPMASYRGEQVAPLSEYEELGLNALRNYMGMGLPTIYGEGTTALGDVLSGRPSTEISPEATEEFFQSSIYNPSKRMFEEDVLPGIKGAYAGTYWGTPRMEAEAEAWEGFGTEMSARRGELMYADEQSRRALAESAAARRLSGIGAVPGMAGFETGLPLQQAQAGATLGMQPRLIQQARLDAQYQNWLQSLPEYSPVIQQALAYQAAQTLQPVVTPGDSGAFGDILGLGIMGLSLASGFGALGGAAGGSSMLSAPGLRSVAPIF